MNAVAAEVAHATPALHHHTFYGASMIGPRHLTTWYVFATDADLARARSSGLAYGGILWLWLLAVWFFVLWLPPK